jgi:hypothetical protein
MLSYENVRDVLSQHVRGASAHLESAVMTEKETHISIHSKAAAGELRGWRSSVATMVPTSALEARTTLQLRHLTPI